MMEYVLVFLASCIVLMYVAKKIHSCRRLAVSSHTMFRPHVTTQGEFMCFAITRRKPSAE